MSFFVNQSQIKDKSNSNSNNYFNLNTFGLSNKETNNLNNPFFNLFSNSNNNDSKSKENPFANNKNTFTNLYDNNIFSNQKNSLFNFGQGEKENYKKELLSKKSFKINSLLSNNYLELEIDNINKKIEIKLIYSEFNTSFNYKVSLSLHDFQQKNVIFKYYQTINDLYNALLKLIENKKYLIKWNDEDNDNKYLSIKIIFLVSSPTGEEKEVEFKLNKDLINDKNNEINIDKKRIEELENKVKKLEERNKEMEDKFCKKLLSLEKKIEVLLLEKEKKRNKSIEKKNVSKNDKKEKQEKDNTKNNEGNIKIKNEELKDNNYNIFQTSSLFGPSLFNNKNSLFDKSENPFLKLYQGSSEDNKNSQKELQRSLFKVPNNLFSFSNPSLEKENNDLILPQNNQLFGSNKCEKSQNEKDAPPVKKK